MSNRGPMTARLAAALAKVPAGRVVTIDVLARHLAINRPETLGLVAAQRELAAGALPWHRVVAEGGAIGRHRHRDRHMARLRAEGVPVSPAGIVDGLADRAVKDLSQPAPGQHAPATPSAPPGRSRGMKSHPS
jgi:methylated-DNA-protein-cysteine methyltransferase-like protein